MKVKDSAEAILARSEYIWSAHDLGILYLTDRATKKKANQEGKKPPQIYDSKRFNDSVSKLNAETANDYFSFTKLECWLTYQASQADAHKQSIQLNLSAIDSAITAATLAESAALTIAKLPNHPEIPDHETIHQLFQDHGLCAYFDREGKAAQNILISYQYWNREYYWLTGWNALVDMFAEAHGIPALSTYKKRLNSIERQADQLNSDIGTLSCMIKDPACKDRAEKEDLFSDVFPQLDYRSVKPIKAIRARSNDLEAFREKIRTLEPFTTGVPYSYIRELCDPNHYA